MASISLRRWTPVVVSSDTPLMPLAMEVHRVASSARLRVSTPSTTAYSSESAVDGSGTAPAFSNSTPLCTSIVASPPSSRIRFGPSPPGHRRTCSVQAQYSSSVSPFQAKTGTPFGSSTVPSGPTATAAAAWSWVEKMLQLAQRTRAPSAVSVSIRTAVWIVMWSDPVMRAPASGWDGPNSARMAIRPGISCSASTISLRPYSARVRSATLKSWVRVSLDMWLLRRADPDAGRCSPVRADRPVRVRPSPSVGRGPRSQDRSVDDTAPSRRTAPDGRARALFDDVGLGRAEG